MLNVGVHLALKCHKIYSRFTNKTSKPIKQNVINMVSLPNCSSEEKQELSSIIRDITVPPSIFNHKNRTNSLGSQ